MLTKRFLIISLDGNAVTTTAEPPYFLSESLLKHIAANQYAGFYVLRPQDHILEQKERI